MLIYQVPFSLNKKFKLVWFQNWPIQWLKDISLWIQGLGVFVFVFVLSFFLLCHPQSISYVLRLICLMITRWLLEFQTSHADVTTWRRRSFSSCVGSPSHTSSMIYKPEFHHIFLIWPGSWNHHGTLIVTLLKHLTLWWRIEKKSSQFSRKLEIRKKRMDAFKTTYSVWRTP